jgi:hypothetical protein
MCRDSNSEKIPDPAEGANPERKAVVTVKELPPSHGIVLEDVKWVFHDFLQSHSIAGKRIVK